MGTKTHCLRQSIARRILYSTPRVFPVSRSIPHAYERQIFIRNFNTTLTHRKLEYEWVDDAESLEMYTTGGYHPVQIGDMFCDRYEVIDKLGFGGYSTVWVVRDSQKERYRKLKVGIADSLPQEASVLRALHTQERRVPGSETIPRLLDTFTINGPNGSHPCYVTTLALGDLAESKFSCLFRRDVARALAYELTLAVAYVHSRGFVHGDIHLRNVLALPQTSVDQLTIAEFREEYGEPESWPVIRRDGQPLTPSAPSTAIVPLYIGKRSNHFMVQDARLLLSDFGESYMPANQVRLGRDCRTPLDYRPPEAYFEPDTRLSFSADVWSLATAIWDILGMQQLFSGFFSTESKFISKTVDCLGPLPADWWDKWKDRRDFFNDDGTPTSGRDVWPRIQDAFKESVQKYRREDNMGEFCSEEEAAILDMMTQLLRYRPEERPTVQQVLQCEWMVNWAQADYKRSRPSLALTPYTTSNWKTLAICVIDSPRPRKQLQLIPWSSCGLLEERHSVTTI